MTHWDLAGASVTGPGHPDNQDAFGWVELDDGVCLIVSDGAGSAPRAAEGAALAVETARSSILLWDHESIEEALVGVLASCVAALGGDKEMACTLSVALWCGGELGMLCVGDSPVFVVRKCLAEGDEVVGGLGEFGPVEHYEGGEHAEFVNETTFLTSGDPMARIEMIEEGSVRAVIVASDGLTHVVSEGGKGVAGFFRPLVERFEAGSLVVSELLEYMNEKKLLGDDTTLVIAGRTDHAR